MTDQAFAALRVIDLTQEGAGAYCARWFADFGAEVIKVEAPTGDPMRALSPFPNDVPNPETGGSFLYLNTGKKSVTLNLEQHAGREILRQLVARSDVLIEDSVLLPGAVVQSGCSIRSSIIGPEAVIGSGSALGPTCVVGAKERVAAESQLSGDVRLGGV